MLKIGQDVIIYDTPTYIERASEYDNVPHLRYNIYYPWTDTVVHMVRQEKLRPLESYTLF